MMIFFNKKKKKYIYIYISGPALGLDQLGHLTREGPKFGGKLFIYLFYINIFERY